MKKMSLMEFKEYCEQISIKRFLFSSEYQPDNSPLGLELSFEQSYTSVSVFLAPNTIAFQDDNHNQLVFEGVKYVNISEKNKGYKAVCEIFCNDAHSSCCGATYIIVMV